MAFECKHCGQCCIDECTQINLSIADIVRIAKFLNVGIGELIPKIGFKPFANPENTNEFDYELRRNIPCMFRDGEKCKIYPARPLNCRIFPYFFLPDTAREAKILKHFAECPYVVKGDLKLLPDLVGAGRLFSGWRLYGKDALRAYRP